MVDSQFFLYEHSMTGMNGPLNYHCFHLTHRFEWQLIHSTEFCIRSVDDAGDLRTIVNISNVEQIFTFHQLYLLNISIQELLSWSNTIDMVEQYQDYLNQKCDPFMSNYTIYKCSNGWFGPKCQYSFDLIGVETFEDAVNRLFRDKEKDFIMSNKTELTCLINFNCRRGDNSICLDWREVCNDHIDCENGEDEVRCFELEMNECDDNEFRCQNGLCISSDLLENNHFECLDKSDEINSAHQTYRFFWEEVHCTGRLKFVCGRGLCSEYYGQCKTGRHLLVSNSISHRKKLSIDCWIAMVCLTQIQTNINGTMCSEILNNVNISRYLESCNAIIVFPENPILSDHVYLIYHPREYIRVQHEQTLLPVYICFDPSICDHLKPVVLYENFTCYTSKQMNIPANMSKDVYSWKIMVNLIIPYFRKCWSRFQSMPSNMLTHPSLYCCQNSTKCISRHRILDRITDCPFDDDEKVFNLSCSIDIRLPIRCDSEPFCRSPLWASSSCPNASRPLDLLEFYEICDRTIHSSTLLINGREHTDETDCEHWPCNNRYTQCNAHWNCPNGEDETGCSETHCPPMTYECVSPYNYTIICLSAQQVSDGIIECLGGADEQEFCRRSYHPHPDFAGFRCMNSTICLSNRHVCDKFPDCPYNDDEEFCGETTEICRSDGRVPNARIMKLICALGINTLHRFSSNEFIMKHHDFKQKSLIYDQNKISMITIEKVKGQKCYESLPALMRIDDQDYRSICFCQPNFYGDQCQYQNERISITMMVHSIQEQGIHGFLVILIDDDDDQEIIHSFHQLTNLLGQTCQTAFKFFLIYPTRPKSPSKNYSVRIHAFDRNSLTYLASWYYPIKFHFLPVYPLGISLQVPIDPVESTQSCPVDCVNGYCIKYVNTEKFFCRCRSGWTGTQCHLSLNCNTCAKYSVCFGTDGIRSICICPVHAFGDRCLLKEYCSNDNCDNDGECIVITHGKELINFGCFCKPGFSGILCNIEAHRMTISFYKIQTPSYVLLHILNLFQSSISITAVEFARIPKKVGMLDQSIKINSTYFSVMQIIQTDHDFYLATNIPLEDSLDVNVTINASNRCPSIIELLNSTLITLPRIQMIKYYYHLCEIHSKLLCFIEELYVCICNKKRETNCIRIDREAKCQHPSYCLNGARCLLGTTGCAKAMVCSCTDCYFGDRCQYYAKGIGLTLDDILRYEIRPDQNLTDQSVAVKVTVILTVLLCLIGFINSVLCWITFYRKQSKMVGVGFYLQASSVSSIMTVTILLLKMIFVIMTQMHPTTDSLIRRIGCKSLEFLIKVCLYTDAWFNGFIAIERMINVYQGVHFNKNLSKRIAKWMIGFLPIIVSLSLLYEPMKRDIFQDREEDRFWCVIEYARIIHNYSTFILFFHMIGPFFINLLSAISIIVYGVRQKSKFNRNEHYHSQIMKQLKVHKHLIYSPIILTILSIPRLIISLLSECVRSIRSPWLYLIGYFISFLPSITVYLVYVTPSDLYRKQFRESIDHLCAVLRRSN